MNKIILLLMIAFFGTAITTTAQLRISTDLRTDASWNDKTEKWVEESEDPDMATFFEFNKEMTMFKHTTPDITSHYIIKSNENNTDGTLTYYIQSDVGNKYTMILDEAGDNIRFIGTNKDDGSKYLVRHHIKRIWTED